MHPFIHPPKTNRLPVLLFAELCAHPVTHPPAHPKSKRTFMWLSRYLPTHRSTHDISPKFRSVSLYRDTHFSKHREHILLDDFKGLGGWVGGWVPVGGVDGC